MTEPTHRPLPGAVWIAFALMVLVALGALVLALLTGERLRDMGPERQGRREGYQVVVKGAETDPATARKLDALLDGGPVPGGRNEADVPYDFPVMAEMPLVPTEVPAPPTRAPEAFAAGATRPLPLVAGPDMPLWQRNAVSVTLPQGAPRLALVLDDMGGQMEASRRAVAAMPAGVTLAFFPWSREGIELAALAKAEGHEIMIHMPMEALPHGETVPEPGPDTLRVGMAPEEIETLLSRNVSRLSDVAVGMNNHMGSRFTQWPEGMRAVLTVMQREGMLFVDSRTSAPTAVLGAAKGLDVPVLTRDVFLDHNPTPAAIRAELRRAVKLAQTRGQALAIGHPLPATLEVLAAELPDIVSSGVVLVPVSALVNPVRE